MFWDSRGRLVGVCGRSANTGIKVKSVLHHGWSRASSHLRSIALSLIGEPGALVGPVANSVGIRQSLVAVVQLNEPGCVQAR
jgi:hypothetical protein